MPPGIQETSATRCEKYFGEGIYAQVEDYWGINQEGELKGAYVPTGRMFPERCVH